MSHYSRGHVSTVTRAELQHPAIGSISSSHEKMKIPGAMLEETSHIQIQGISLHLVFHGEGWQGRWLGSVAEHRPGLHEALYFILASSPTPEVGGNKATLWLDMEQSNKNIF